MTMWRNSDAGRDHLHRHIVCKVPCAEATLWQSNLVTPQGGTPGFWSSVHFSPWWVALISFLLRFNDNCINLLCIQDQLIAMDPGWQCVDGHLVVVRSHIQINLQRQSLDILDRDPVDATGSNEETVLTFSFHLFFIFYKTLSCTQGCLSSPQLRQELQFPKKCLSTITLCDKYLHHMCHIS